MGELLHLGEGTGPLLVVPNVTIHTSTASVTITVLLYNGPLLCGFNVRIKGLMDMNNCELPLPGARRYSPPWTLPPCRIGSGLQVSASFQIFL